MILQVIINYYGAITESCEHSFSSPVRKKVKKDYENKLTSLPALLSIDVVIVCESNKCCIDH